MRAALPLLALLAMGAAPDSFTRDELDVLLAEKAQAESRLAALEAARDTAVTDLSTLEARLVAAAMETLRREEQASMAERRMIDLSVRRDSLRDALVRNHGDLEDLLGALALSGRGRAPALLTSSSDASQAVRSAILMRDAAPELKARTDALREEMAALDRVERSLVREGARLAAAEAVLAQTRFEIEMLLAQRQASTKDLSREADSLRREVAALAQRAGTLEQLLAGLDAMAPPRPGAKPAAPSNQFASISTTPSEPRSAPAPRAEIPDTVRGLDETGKDGLTRPASGLIVRKFGDVMTGGTRADGMTWATREEAQIVAPADGQIVYAGDFRSYGRMLILSTKDGYHIVLSGMADIYGSKDQWVKAGEPVGRMAARAEPPPELYLEVRRDGTPMDPAQWLAAGRGTYPAG